MVLARLVLTIVVSLAAAWDHGVHAQERPPGELVLVQQGGLPVILTAPHGGREPLSWLEPRHPANKNNPAFKAWGGFGLSGDANTDVLAMRLADQIRALTGRSPYLVMARFTRQYVDANRPAALAYDDPRAKPYYDYYHASIRRFVDEVRGRFSTGILIDIHGQARDPGVVMRGTLNGRAVSRLLHRAGYAAIIGANGLFGRLEANGFKVFPANNVPPAGTSEDAGFKGGYTVWLYGSHTDRGIDSVQFEFGSAYRQQTVLDTTARNAAKAITEFWQAFLRKAPV
jgi:N-formylglutamate amidohydrolase